MPINAAKAPSTFVRGSSGAGIVSIPNSDIKLGWIFPSTYMTRAISPFIAHAQINRQAIVCLFGAITRI